VSVLVDTPVIIDHLRNDARAVSLLTDLFREHDRVWAATPTRTEILAGIRSRKRSPILALFDILAWVDIDIAVADAAGALAQR